jgi:hypothetical protein
VVNKAELGQVSSEYFSFPHQFSFRTHLSSGADTTSTKMGCLTPSQEAKEKTNVFYISALTSIRLHTELPSTSHTLVYDCTVSSTLWCMQRSPSLSLNDSVISTSYILSLSLSSDALSITSLCSSKLFRMMNWGFGRWLQLRKQSMDDSNSNPTFGPQKQANMNMTRYGEHREGKRSKPISVN